MLDPELGWDLDKRHGEESQALGCSQTREGGLELDIKKIRAKIAL